MAAIHDLLAQIQDEALRERIEKEIDKLSKTKKFGLVFEEHMPECTPLYDVPVKRGATVAKRDGAINDIYVVQSMKGENAICMKKSSDSIEEISVSDLVSVAEFGDPIYPYLKPLDVLCNAPDNDLWHSVIEADNYHALQLLEYLYAGKIDCIYIDPPYNTGAKDWKYNNDYVDSSDSYRHSKWLSFMEKRLKLAKKLLNPKDSVLIVTIDEKEYLHLGCLLEEVFSDAKMQMISSAINGKGVARVIGLTGTPSSNGLMDLFAEFKCLDMGERLGRFISQYRVNYFVPDRMNGPIVYSYKLRNGAEEQIYEKISDITISMKALDHLRMPEFISNEYPVYMNDEEAKFYADMEENLFVPLKKGEITAANAAALSGKLLQMANGAVYSDDGDELVIHDQKLDALEDMIEAANGRPVMVAYWFKHDLSRIMRRLTEKKIPFEKLDSEESIRKWNRGELPVALIHPASAGHGLNLQLGGNTLIWFGLTWSLELYQQTVARLWRQGQTAETVVVQHIITAGTIDEDVMKALANKDMTQNRLIAAVKARVTHGR